MSAFLPENKKKDTEEYESIDQNNLEPGKVTVNCSVAYMGQYMSWNKCKASCTSMGATSYRWFHDGCCECVGSQCINNGVNESRCSDCPVLDDIDEEITDEEMELLVNMDFDDFENNKLEE